MASHCSLAPSSPRAPTCSVGTTIKSIDSPRPSAVSVTQVGRFGPVGFIRERAQPADNRSRHDQQPEGDQQPEDTATEGPSSDVRIALRVLGKRPRQAPGAPKNRVDLGFLDLSRVDLHGANLDSVRLDGSCLRGAQLSDASLNSASLKRVHLEGAELSSADLRYADLQNATLTDAVFYEALTKGTRVWGCNLDSILLSDAQTAAMDFGDYG